MNNYLIVGVLSLAPILAALLFLYRTLALRPADPSAAMDQLLAPATKYRPMERLLRDEDFAFLAQQPGFTPRLGRSFRAERRRIFRGYLRSLRRDFARAVSACHLLVVHSAEDRADLASALIEQRLKFGLAVLAVEGRLMLHALGARPVDVHGLIESLETMQSQMRILLANSQIAAAEI